MQPVQTIDLTGSAPSPALVRPGTAGAEDVKGKGKAEELLSAVKREPLQAFRSLRAVAYSRAARS